MSLGRAFPVACGALLLVAAAPPRPGVYGNVLTHRETGDLLGMELRIPDAAPWIEFVLCEGWCNRVVRIPVTRRQDGFDFVYREATVHGDGTPAEPFTIAYHARRAGNALILTEGGQGGRHVLKRLKMPFGLAVAASEMR